MANLLYTAVHTCFKVRTDMSLCAFLVNVNLTNTVLVTHQWRILFLFVGIHMFSSKCIEWVTSASLNPWRIIILLARLRSDL